MDESPGSRRGISDFNAHLIDFDEVINRCKIYRDEERKRSENCNLIKMANKI